MGTVFVVTDGDYSAYRIVAVFPTREAAERFVAWYGVAEIEEWVLGPPIPQTGCWDAVVSVIPGGVLGPIHARWERDKVFEKSAWACVGSNLMVYVHGYGKTERAAIEACRDMARAIIARTVIVDEWEEALERQRERLRSLRYAERMSTPELMELARLPDNDILRDIRQQQEAVEKITHLLEIEDG